MVETNTGSEPVGVGDGGRSRTGLGIALHSLLVVLAVVPPFQLLVPAILLSAGIRYGSRAASITLAIAVAVVFLGAGGAEAPDARLSAISAAGPLLFQMGIPAMALLRLSELRVDGGRALIGSLGIAIIGMMIVETGLSAAFGYSPYRALSVEARALFDQVIAMNSSLPAESRRMMEQMGNAIVGTFLPAVIVCNTALMLAVSMVFVPRFKRGDEAAEAFRLRNLKLPDFLIVGFVVSGLSPFATGAIRDVGLNVLAVVILLYWLQGLAVVRMMLTRSAFRFFRSVPAFLLLAVLAFNWLGIAALALTGLFDSFFDFRKKKRKEDSDESDLDG
jgi:hypothetical protein